MARSLLAPRSLQMIAFRSLFGKSEAGLVKPPVPMFGVDGRYATALYSAAAKKKKLDQIDADLKKISDLCQRDAPFRDLLLNPLVKAGQKAEIISNALSSKLKVDELTTNLVAAMAENGRLKYLPHVARQFNRVMALSRGEIEVTVTTARALDEQQRKEVEESLKGFAPGKKLTVTVKTDPEIIGGMVVDFGGEHYLDMSIRTKFNMYSNILRQTV